MKANILATKVAGSRPRGTADITELKSTLTGHVVAAFGPFDHVLALQAPFILEVFLHEVHLVGPAPALVRWVQAISTVATVARVAQSHLSCLEVQEATFTVERGANFVVGVGHGEKVQVVTDEPFLQLRREGVEELGLLC